MGRLLGPYYSNAHAVIDDQRITQAIIMDEMKRRLKKLFGIEHTTIQLEGKSCGQGMVVCPVENGKV